MPRNHVLQRIPPDFDDALDRMVPYVTGKDDMSPATTGEIEWNYPLGTRHAAIEDVEDDATTGVGDAGGSVSVDEDAEARGAIAALVTAYNDLAEKYNDLAEKFNLLLAHFRERKIIEE